MCCSSFQSWMLILLGLVDEAAVGYYPSKSNERSPHFERIGVYST